MSEKKEINKVAVYGSLRKGLHNHRIIQHSKFLGTFESLPIYTMYSIGSFPGLVKKGTTSVVMEVYEVNESEMHSVNVLEGFGGDDMVSNHYNRFEIDTPFGKAYAFEYNYPLDGLDEVPQGDWKRYTEELKQKETTC